MNVATLLGLEDPGDGLLQVAGTRWPAWQEHHDVLRVVDDFADLKATVRRLEPSACNKILVALAERGKPDGGNEAAATAALVWLLLPGAAHMAGRLKRELPQLRDEVDQLVAGQVWIQARTVRISEESPTSCAATVLRNAERQIRRELGIHGRSDHAHGRAVFIGAGCECEEVAGKILQTPALVVPAEVELRGLFDTAIAAGVISHVDARLLLEVARHADIASGGRPGRRGGLMSEVVCEAVAHRRGCSPRSIRRRTHSALAKLRASTQPSMGRSA